MNDDRIFHLDESALTSRQVHGGEGEVLTRRLLDSAGLRSACHFIDHAVLPPGTSIGLHTHGADEEIYLILEGEGTMTLDDREFPVRAGHVVVNRVGGTHGLRNDGDRPLRIFVVEIAAADEGTSDG